MTAPIPKKRPYKKDDKYSILEYSQFLKGKTFWEVLEKDPNLTDEQKDSIKEFYGNRKTDDGKYVKGRYGNFIEENFFYIDRNSRSEADFNEAGVELKVSGYKKNKNGISAKERLKLTSIDFKTVREKSYKESHLLGKCEFMLLVYYYYDNGKLDQDYFINYVDFFQIPEKDEKIIENDYNTIIKKITDGKAHLLSEGDTLYLGACRNGRKTDKDLTEQPFNKEVKALKRAFCFKQTYMTYILREYLSKGIHPYSLDEKKLKKTEYGSVIENFEDVKKAGFDSYILNKFEPYIGKKASELVEEFGIKKVKIKDKKTGEEKLGYPKNVWNMIAKRMLGIQTKKIEEFEKADIELKAIRLNMVKTPCESMSFPAFDYIEVSKQDYYDSDLFNNFSSKRYLFVIFEYTNTKYKDDSLDNIVFTRAMFWQTPLADLEGKIKDARLETQRRINLRMYENLVAESEEMIIHVRMHGQNRKDTSPTPEGGQEPKRCFWFNKMYIKEQIEKGGN